MLSTLGVFMYSMLEMIVDLRQNKARVHGYGRSQHSLIVEAHLQSSHTVPSGFNLMLPSPEANTVGGSCLSSAFPSSFSFFLPSRSE